MINRDDISNLSIEAHKIAHNVLIMREAHKEYMQATRLYIDVVTKSSEAVLLSEQSIQNILKDKVCE